jgi:hypothetical protein
MRVCEFGMGRWATEVARGTRSTSAAGSQTGGFAETLWEKNRTTSSRWRGPVRVKWSNGKASPDAGARSDARR